MWTTGFDVDCLDTMYIDKPLQQHTLVQTISRVNRVYPGKEKGLVVDYIGIKSNMNVALKRYAQGVQEIAARNPDKFVDFVKQFSTGRSAEREGVLGSFSPGDLSKDFSSVFALQKGDVSALIETAAGYHIIRVDDVVHGESSAWKATMDQCREQIAMKESQRLVVSWLNDLMEKNFVSILVNEDLSK